MGLEAFAVLVLIVLTLFLPPIGVFMVSGCSTDLMINILFTLLGYFPGHIHAFYCEYIYYDRRSRNNTNGRVTYTRAPFIFSDHIQSGGLIPQNDVPYPP